MILRTQVCTLPVKLNYEIGQDVQVRDATSIRKRTWAVYMAMIPWVSRCETRRTQLIFHAAFPALVGTCLVKVRALFTSTPRMRTNLHSEGSASQVYSRARWSRWPHTPTQLSLVKRPSCHTLPSAPPESRAMTKVSLT